MAEFYQNSLFKINILVFVQPLSDFIAYGYLDKDSEAMIAAFLVRDNVIQGIQAVVGALEIAMNEKDSIRYDVLMSALQELNGPTSVQTLIDIVSQGTPYMSSEALTDDTLDLLAKALAHTKDSNDMGRRIALEMASANPEARERLAVLAKQNAAALLELSSYDVDFTVLLEDGPNSASNAANLGKLAARAENATLVNAIDEVIFNRRFTEIEIIDFSLELGRAINEAGTVLALVEYIKGHRLSSGVEADSLKKLAVMVALTRSETDEAEQIVKEYLDITWEKNPSHAMIVHSLIDEP